MSNIEQEIEQIADQLEKSNQTPKERLFQTIRQLGPKEIKARLSTLEKSEKELLLEALQEMSKAVEMDKNYAAEFVQGKLKATIIQEDKADDDQDEKLVSKDPEAATVNHQGTPTPGWEGQVIKAKKDMSKKEPKEEKIKNQPEDAEDKQLRDMKKSIEILSKHGAEMLAMFSDDIEKGYEGFKAVSDKAAKEGAKDPDAVAAAVGRKKYGKENFQQMAAAGKKVKKSEEDMDKAKEILSKKQGVPAGVDPEKQERCVRKLKGDKGKNAYAICNASMKKGEPITPEVKEALIEIKKSVEEQLKEFGVQATPELVKAEMKRLLKEEDQDGDAPEMDVKTRANKEKVPALEMGKDNKEAQDKVNDEKQGKNGMKKAIWSGENDLLKANTNGRNHHFSMEEYLNAVLASAADKKEEPIQKSATEKKDDLNDIIEKSQDANWDMVNTDRLLKANNEKVKGKFVKSFEDNEIAQALGLTEEEAKKILGE